MTDQPKADNADANTQPGSNLGRNEPCYCGSGKKFKRCHGVGAAPKITPPKTTMPAADATGQGAPGGAFPGGFDPSKMDPQMMLQFTQALQRLPKGQLQRLQSIMQRAMAGKDVTRESEEFERTLPPDIQQLMISFATQMQGMGGMPGMGAAAPALPAIAGPSAPSGEGEMTEEQARQIVAAAAAEGKISQDDAQKLLENEKKTGFGKFWRGITGKGP